MAGTGGPVFDAERRSHLAAAFLEGGDHYHKVRPGYPRESLDWLLQDSLLPVGHAVDVGAGTGKYTQLLTRRGWQVSAVDPSSDMLDQLTADLPEVDTHVGVAEKLPLPGASVDLAVVAQAWHWCDPLAASTEIARVLRTGGTLGLVWNQLDVGLPWVHRLARIMHAGDVHREDFRPVVGSGFTAAQVHRTRWVQSMTPGDIMDLANSRSYYLKATAHVRAKVMANLHWYLHEHLGHAAGEELELPYVTQTWRSHKR